MKNPAVPHVTVVMPTYNSATYLPEAIESILNQTFTDLRLAVLDGGSTDPTGDIVRSYAARDSRVSLEVFPDVHPTERVDAYLYRTRSAYVAMQHSDDISYKNRIERQLQFMKENSELAVTSAWYRSFWHDRRRPAPTDGIHIHQRPTSHEDIKANLPFWWVMHAATFMFDVSRVTVAGLRFKNDFSFANDYWQSITNIDKLRYGNLPEELSAYRIHFQSDGNSNVERIRAEERRVKARALKHFGFTFSEEDLEIHLGIHIYPENKLSGKAAKNIPATLAWLSHMREQNQRSRCIPMTEFDAVISDLMAKIESIS